MWQNYKKRAKSRVPRCVPNLPSTPVQEPGHLRELVSEHPGAVPQLPEEASGMRARLSHVQNPLPVDLVAADSLGLRVVDGVRDFLPLPSSPRMGSDLFAVGEDGDPGVGEPDEDPGPDPRMRDRVVAPPHLDVAVLSDPVVPPLGDLVGFRRERLEMGCLLLKEVHGAPPGRPVRANVGHLVSPPSQVTAGPFHRLERPAPEGASLRVADIALGAPLVGGVAGRAASGTVP